MMESSSQLSGYCLHNCEKNGPLLKSKAPSPLLLISLLLDFCPRFYVVIWIRLHLFVLELDVVNFRCLSYYSAVQDCKKFSSLWKR